MIFSCERNREPLASEISFEPDKVSAGAVLELKIEAYDQDGDHLDYFWESSHGEFITATDLPEVTWKAPADGEGQSVTISVTISDEEYEVVRDTVISLAEPLLGSVAGHVYFQNTKFPIPDVNISVADKETVSDQDGYFLISDLLVGNDSLVGSKKDFSTKKMSINIPYNDVKNISFEMLSIVNSSKIFGVVSDQYGKAIEFAEVTLLNPDGLQSGLSDVTDENGLYRISYIPHGWHTLLVRVEANENERFEDLHKYVEFSNIEQEVNLFVEKEILVGEFTDPRDNHVYSFRKIGDIVWMTENLAYLPEVSSSSLMSDSDPHYYVYGYNGNDTAQAKQTNNFMQYGALYNWEAAKVSCPRGWHLPSNFNYSYSLGRFLGENEGHKMKSQSGWYNSGNGDNSSGFSALPGGNLTVSDEFDTKIRSKSNGFSVRCVRDD